jgi:hypothetical protein
VELSARRVGKSRLVGHFSLTDRGAGASLKMTQLTMVGSVRDACGSVPSQSYASLQFEGTGTYNGGAATFRVCVQQNAHRDSEHDAAGARDVAEAGRQARAEESEHEGPASANFVHVSCTSGCSYEADGAFEGRLTVSQEHDD